MSEYEFRRAASRFCADDLRDKFNEWLGKGHFTLKGIEPEDLIGPSLAPILFLQVSCSVRADWTARVGEMDQAAYDRDLNLYRTQQQIWEDGGKRGLAPRYPGRDNYVRWSTDQGYQTDTFTCNSKYTGYLKGKRGAFAGTEFEDYGIVLGYLDKASDKSSNVVWQAWGNAKNDSEHELDQEVVPTAKSIAEAVAYDRMKQKIERGPLAGYKSFSNLKMDVQVEVDSIQLLEVPFYSIVYRYDGKAYAWVTDGLHAERQFGSRPLDKKKAAKASAAAALTVLVAAAGLTIFTRAGDEVGQSEPVAFTTDIASPTAALRTDQNASAYESGQSSLDQEGSTTSDDGSVSDGAMDSLQEGGTGDNTSAQPGSNAAHEPDGRKIMPIGPRPANSPQTWVSYDDLPAQLTQEKIGGRVGFRLTVDPEGNVSNCSITAASGYPELDEATCSTVAKRAKFYPAYDSDRQPTTGTYSNVVTWKP